MTLQGDTIRMTLRVTEVFEKLFRPLGVSWMSLT